MEKNKGRFAVTRRGPIDRTPFRHGPSPGRPRGFGHNPWTGRVKNHSCGDLSYAAGQGSPAGDYAGAGRDRYGHPNPPPVLGLRSSYRKIRARRAWDFALAGVALAVPIEEDKVRRARVVFSGVASVPWRSRQVEETILGKRLVRETVGKAADAAVKDAEPMKKNGYKVPLLKAVVEEELSAGAKRTQPT